VANGPNIFQMLLVLKIECILFCLVFFNYFGIFGPILWGHSGPLCHALSLLSSSSLLLWTSMCRRRATVAACDSSDTW